MTSRTLAETEETTTYVWTCMNRLRQRQVAGVPQETNAYDAGGIRRLKKDAATGDSTKYFSSGAVSIADKTPTGNISFIQGGQLLGMLQNGNFYFYIADGLGSVRVLVDSDGDEAASASYNEFGMPENVSDSGGLMKHGYVGALGVRNETAGSGLLYMRQRWYDPSIGSWLSRDPIGVIGGFNTTNYAGQNPANLSDSTGLAPNDVLDYDDHEARIYLPDPRDKAYAARLEAVDEQALIDTGTLILTLYGIYELGLLAAGVAGVLARGARFGPDKSFMRPSGTATMCQQEFEESIAAFKELNIHVVPNPKLGRGGRFQGFPDGSGYISLGEFPPANVVFVHETGHAEDFLIRGFEGYYARERFQREETAYKYASIWYTTADMAQKALNYLNSYRPK